MANNEATARIKINKLLEEAGWRFFPENGKPANIRLEATATLKQAELDALGRDFEHSKKGFIDFLLLDARNFPLIVLEAKSEDKNPLSGKEQAHSVPYNHIRINSGMLIFRPNATQLTGHYLYHFFQSKNFRIQCEAIVSGAAQPQLPIRSLNEATIPLPSLETQRAIVAEIEAEQSLVAASRKLITRFEKKIEAVLARVWGNA